MNKFIIAIIVLICFSCKGNEMVEMPKEATMKCDKFFAKGQIKYDIYTFCSTMPKEIQYYNKKGKWKFWNQEGGLIAEGTYKPEGMRIEDHGGCVYELTVGKIEKEKWKFWSSDGNPIIPSDELIEELETCNIAWIK